MVQPVARLANLDAVDGEPFQPVDTGGVVVQKQQLDPGPVRVMTQERSDQQLCVVGGAVVHCDRLDLHGGDANARRARRRLK